MRNAPDKNILEINLFGGGSSIGECILCHLGNNRWLSVDSFINPNTKKSIILEYFNEIGVDIKSIELIVATHWHDDHIKGISQLYKESESKIYISEALNKEQLSLIISQNDFKDSANTGLHEFSESVQHSINNKLVIGRAVEDRILYEKNKEENIRITSLSPSDKSIEVFQKEMTKVINEAYDLNLRTKKINPNLSSIVLLIEVSGNKVLLGSDLEITTDKNMGWDAAINTNSSPKDKSIDIFKIAHHGSENGHHEEVWTTMIADKSIAILTPYGKGRKKLPSPNDKERILNLTEQAYITSKNLSSTKGKKRDRTAEKIIKELGYKVKERKYEYGHIQMRKDLIDKEQVWQVSLFGNACNLEKLSFN